jgi:predicted XRE-type DNA-binding protein
MAAEKKIPMELARVISDYGITQRDIGDVFGVSQSTISRKMSAEKK